MTQRPTSRQYLALYEKQKTFGTVNYLSVVDIIFRPHMQSSDSPKYNFSHLNETADGLSSDLYALTDRQAIIVNDGAMSFVGGDIIKIEKVYEI